MANSANPAQTVIKDVGIHVLFKFDLYLKFSYHTVVSYII